MRNLFFILAITLLSKNILAQQSYFSKRFDFNGSSGENSSSIISTDSGFLILFSTTNSLGGTGLLQTGLMLLGDTGNLQHFQLYSIPNDFIFNGGWGNLIKQPNKGLVTLGSLEDTIQADAFLMKFDSLQDTVWTRVYGDSLFQSGWMVRQTRDHGFVLVGQTATYDLEGDVLLIKTDSNGTEQWQKQYGGTFYDIGTCLDTCFDGGFIIGGSTKSYGVGAGSHFGNPYAIKTDSNGNIEWSKEFGGIYDDGFWNCFQSKDGNYIFAGYYTYSDPNFPSFCCESYSRPYIVKLDTSGNILWEKKYGEINIENFINSVKELPNGDIISAGMVFYDDSVYNQFRGLILKVNSQGDSLWYRTYNSLQGNHSDSYLYDIAATSDGGFVATGWNYPKPPDTGSQDIWVLKVDSNGCEVVNCVMSGVQELQHSVESIQIFPNPSDGLFYLENNTKNEIKITEVYNMLGERVFFKKGVIKEIDLRNDPSGIYFYKVETKNRNIFSGKMVKQ